MEKHLDWHREARKMEFSRLGSLGVVLALLIALGGGLLPTIAREAKSKEQAGFLIVDGEESQSRFGDLDHAEPAVVATGLESPIRHASHAVPYYPQPGDIFLYDHLVPWHHLVFKLAGHRPPTPPAIAVG